MKRSLEFKIKNNKKIKKFNHKLTVIVEIKDIFFNVIRFLNCIEIYRLSISNKDLYDYINKNSYIWQFLYLRDIEESKLLPESLSIDRRMVINRRLYIKIIKKYKCDICNDLIPIKKRKKEMTCDICAMKLCYICMSKDDVLCPSCNGLSVMTDDEKKAFIICKPCKSMMQCSICNEELCICCVDYKNLSICDICGNYHCKNHDGIDCSEKKV